MELEGMLINLPESTVDANLIRDIVMKQLLADKIVTEEQFNHYLQDWQIVLFKTSWFKHWANKMFSKEEDRNVWRYKFVKFI